MSKRYRVITVNGKRVPEHIAVWESYNGPKPPGCDIHHIDGNGKNNDITNLVCLTKADHQMIHRMMRKAGIDVIDVNDPIVQMERAAARAERRAAYAADPTKFHERDKKYREENRDKIQKREKRHYLECRDEIREAQRLYELEHKEERAARNAKYYQEHSEERKAYRKQYAEEHKEAISAQRRQHRLEHLDEIQARAAAYRERYRPYLAAKQRVYMAKKRGLPSEEIERLEAEAEQLRKECDQKGTQNGQV